ATPPTLSDDVNPMGMGSAANPVVINSPTTATASRILYNAGGINGAPGSSYMSIQSDLTITNEYYPTNFGAVVVDHTGGTVNIGGSFNLRSRDNQSYWNI